jgi:hypothetical protein
MTMVRRPWFEPVALAAGLLVLAAGCGGSSDTASGTTTAAAPATTASTSTTTAQPAAPTLTVPLDVVASPNGEKVLVQASIGGGPTVPMVLDTGSSGVVVASSALGSAAEVTSQAADMTYASATINGVVADATLTMGPLTTVGPIAVVDARSAACNDGSSGEQPCDVATALGAGVGAQGIIGIGLSNGPSPASPNYSPLLQVAAPYDQGFTIQLPTSGSGAGSLVVGPVSAPPAAVAVPFVASTAPTYPNGAKAYAKDFPMCWTVGPASACGPTDLDIGSPHTVLTPSEVPTAPVTDGDVTTGTTVQVAATQGGLAIWSLTAGTTAGKDMVEVKDELGAATAFNSGIAFFFANVVAWDVGGARLLVWPQG